MALKLPHLPALPLGPRTRKVVRALGYVVFAITVFLFALQWTFPFDRVAGKLTDVANDKGYDLAIGSTERGILPGVVYFKNVTLKTRPSAADLDRVSKIDDLKEREKERAALVTMVYIEKLEIDLGIFALVRKKLSVDLDAKIGPGHIKGNIGASTKGATIELTGRDLPARNLPLREAFSGLPMGGTVRFDFDLDLPNATSKAGKTGPDWSQADGELTFECPSKCTLGDGEAKFHPKIKNPRNEASVKNGIKFGTVNLDSFLAKVEVKKGTLEVKKFDVASKDIELKLEVVVNLASDLNDSRVAGCTRYKPTDALAKREGDTFSAFMLIGGPLGPDTLYHVKLDGTFRDMKKLALTCGPSANTNMDDPSGGSGKSSTPKLSIPPPTTTPKVNPPPPNVPMSKPADVEVHTGSATIPMGSGSGSGSAVPAPPPEAPVGSGSTEPATEGQQPTPPQPSQ